MAATATKTRNRSFRRAAWLAVARGRELAETMEGERSPLKVDKDKGIIYGVKVLGRNSNNVYDENAPAGTEYTPDAMRKAVDLYEGVTVRVNHPTDRRNPGVSRDVHDTFGQLRNVRFENDSLRADLHYLKSHDLAETVVEDVERGLGVYGLSHNARAGRETVKNGRLLIEEIKLVRSVDLVDKPATNRNLWESQAMPAKNLRELLEAAMPKLSKKRKAWAKNLLEDDTPVATAAMDAPMDDTPADPADALAAGFRAAIVAVLDSDGDIKSKIKKIADLLKTEEKLLATEDPADVPTETAEEEEDSKAKKDGMTEGDEGGDADKKDKTESLRIRLETMERKDKARDLCESLGFTPTKEQLADLLGITAAATQKRVAEAYKLANAGGEAKPGRGPRSRTPSGTGRNVAESRGGTTANGAPKLPATVKGLLNRFR